MQHGKQYFDLREWSYTVNERDKEVARRAERFRRKGKTLMSGTILFDLLEESAPLLLLLNGGAFTLDEAALVLGALLLVGALFFFTRR